MSELLAGRFYLFAALRLLRLARRTREAPELLLGFYFALSGAAYVAWALPVLIDTGSFAWDASVGAALIYDVSVVSFLLFIRAAFRSEDAWSGWVVSGCVVVLFAGVAKLILDGNMEPPPPNPWFYLHVLGYTFPCAWVCWEASLCYVAANRRLRLGLSDPAVANRYGLLALFGGFQILACLMDIVINVDYEGNLSGSAWMFALGSAFEIASITLVWLAFFPPASYSRWIASSIPATGEVSHG